MAIGFRNSHNKTLALRIAAGTNVVICSNMMITGDIQERKTHTSQINPGETIQRAFDKMPGEFDKLFGWMSELKVIRISTDEGVSFLAEAVEKFALPVEDFLDARKSFILACRHLNPTIQYGNTLWGAYQAITEQWKKHNMDRIQERSKTLNSLVTDKTGLVLN